MRLLTFFSRRLWYKNYTLNRKLVTFVADAAGCTNCEKQAPSVFIFDILTDANFIPN